MAASELLEAGGFDYEEALQTLSVAPDISQRIAVLKAASRAKIERQGEWLIAASRINSFEGSAAAALIDLGQTWPLLPEGMAIGSGSAPGPAAKQRKPA
jgi:hypothetical protein